MKVLLLTLVLGLVYADQPTTDLSQFSGEWKTLYVASNYPKMTSEDGLFMGFLRKLNFDTASATISFDVLFKKNGECIAQSFTGTRIKGNVFLMTVPNLTVYEHTYASATSQVGYFIIMDENNEVFITALMFGKSNHVNEQDFEKFKEVIREKNIPEANIVNYINLDYVLRNRHVFSVEPDQL